MPQLVVRDWNAGGWRWERVEDGERKMRTENRKIVVAGQVSYMYHIAKRRSRDRGWQDRWERTVCRAFKICWDVYRKRDKNERDPILKWS